MIEPIVRGWNDGIKKGNRNRGPVDCYKKIVRDLGWTTKGHDCFQDHLGKQRSSGRCHGFVKMVVTRARQVLWSLASRTERITRGLKRELTKRPPATISERLLGRAVRPQERSIPSWLMGGGAHKGQ